MESISIVIAVISQNHSYLFNILKIKSFISIMKNAITLKLMFYYFQF